MLDSGVHLTVIECAAGNESFACENPPMSDPSHAKRFMHVGVRAKTRGWFKENLLNLGIQRRPEAQYIGWFDADIYFRRPDWAMASLHALQHYDVIQPWSTCYDLGPNGEHITAHTSFCRQFFNGQPLAPDNWREPYWIGNGGKHTYPHCLPGDTLVLPGGKILAASVRDFEGDLVVIRTASGQEMSCSPNHPVLSGGRWQRADSLSVGDNVLRHVRGGGTPAEPHKQQAPARIDDIVRAFREHPGANRSTTLLPDNLDNRRANSKVAEVWTHGNLAPEVDARRGQHVSDLAFGRVVSMSAARGNSVRPHDLFCQALAFSPASHQAASPPRLSPELGGRFFEHASADGAADFLPALGGVTFPSSQMPRFCNRPRDAHDLMLTPDFFRHAVFDQRPGVSSAHADNPAGLVAALAGQIETDEIVYVGRHPFSGQLYDLQTEHGHIIADGILTHNSGYCWIITRQGYDWVGGLFEFACMGSGDHHMALGFAGLAHKSLPPGPNSAYCEEVMRWGNRSKRHINGNIGYIAGTIEHNWHGKKSDRGYLSRWGMFVEHGFDPREDLKRNAHGVLEFATNKPDLRRAFDRYLQSRNEDGNCM
jgi:hypothetical protein